MTSRVLILVEGQTEERFIKDVLAPYFYPMNLFFYPTLLVTKRVKVGPNFKGGVTNFAKFENDLIRLLNGAGDALVTTMIDYYGLPKDFPGMNTRPKGTPLERVEHVEEEIHKHFGKSGNLRIFLVLHEFEAWLFSTTEDLPRVMTDPGKQQQFAAVRDEFKTPEEINERPDFAPSKRIESLFPAFRKTFHGLTTAARIGLDRIRKECAHFNWWIEHLERFAKR